VWAISGFSGHLRLVAVAIEFSTIAAKATGEMKR